MIKKISEFLYTKKQVALEKISREEYRKIFIEGRTPEQIQTTYDKAWAAKNFEIDNYWKRATYFWAFQVASFTGYFAVLNSGSYAKTPETLYSVICIGIITSLAWTFANKGSKTWQKNWEIHVDMLEDEVTGPLYKTVTAGRTFSVSNINEIVSTFIFSIWVVLSYRYLSFHGIFDQGGILNASVLLITIFTLYFALAMYFGRGRGMFGDGDAEFYIRKRSGGH